LFIHRFLGFENIVDKFGYIHFSLNFALVVAARLFVTYIDHYVNTIKLEEFLDNEARIVEIKSREQANKEMQLMFQSLEDSIVLVDKKNIAF
jgi:S-adenosylmethionine:tRNA-ribosyltransferase-isomerase (queuine synthetase)